ncbi:hypothetical protein [Parahaliea mediterranea]|uniref:hypothetical protein n=1 Tax=Parahaliea mediterranea TaxID=651086 RepID=UPI000E2F96F8|nr:hypothetical protein [Parahaliea mediterranea]
MATEQDVNRLTSEEITNFLDQFELRCPVCNSDEFTLPTLGGPTGRRPILVVNEVSSGFNVEGQVMILEGSQLPPAVQIVCRECAYTMRFDAVALVDKIYPAKEGQ